MLTLHQLAEREHINHSTAWRRVMRREYVALRLPDRRILVAENEHEARDVAAIFHLNREPEPQPPIVKV